MSQCIDCRGTGEITCPTCDGKGEIRNTSYFPGLSEISTIADDWQECPSCDGSGKKTCPRCDGSGYYDSD